MELAFSEVSGYAMHSVNMQIATKHYLLFLLSLGTVASLSDTDGRKEIK